MLQFSHYSVLLIKAPAHLPKEDFIQFFLTLKIPPIYTFILVGSLYTIAFDEPVEQPTKISKIFHAGVQCKS